MTCNSKETFVGDQLWTSPVTGYRRKGTRLAELRVLLGAGITARSLFEPLRSCPAGADADQMSTILQRRDFDVAGVQEEPGGAVIGFVEVSSLTGGRVRDHMKVLQVEHLLSEATPLPTLVGTIADRQRAFVLVDSDVRGIVTRSDLNKPPVRVYLFGLISLLEMHMDFWIRATYEAESWRRGLQNHRIKKAEKLRADRGNRGLEVSLLDCLQFCDKRDLIVCRPDLREALTLGDQACATAVLTRAEDLRNNLAHSQVNLALGSSWTELAALVRSIEAAVHGSDRLVESKAQVAGMGQDELWACA